MNKKHFIRTAVARHPPSKSVTLSEAKEWPQNQPNLGSAVNRSANPLWRRGPNEIDRLTAEVEKYKEWYRKLIETGAFPGEADGENARLRAALEEIAALKTHPDDPYWRALDEAPIIARKALANEQDK